MATIEKRKIQIALPSTGEEEWQAVREPIMTGWLTSGPKVREFERLFAERHNVKHAIAVTSCTTALHLALAALDIKEGDEVLVPAFTWVSTANAVLFCNATPVFVDVDPKTFNIDPNDIAHRITERTKAIIPVHLFGLCADMDAIRAVAPGLHIIEDGACAAGAAYKGVPAGALGDFGCFSFHPRKSVTTGEGGMVTTNNDAYAEKMQILRNHGASVSEEIRHLGSKPYLLPDFDVMGFNFRMTDLQGAMGIVQLSKLDKFIDEREIWAKYYEEQLADVDWLRTPHVPEGYKNGWQSYPCFVDESKAPHSRNEIMEILQEKGVSTRPGTHAVHMLNFYAQKYNIKPADYPGAQASNDYSMAIPLHNRMTKEDYDYVIEAIKSIC